MTRPADQAVEMLNTGFNCAQSILTCCGQEGDLNREDALAVAGAFGGGMGATGNVCGAVTGAVMVIGLRYPRTNPADDRTRQECTRLVRELFARFQARNGSLLCKDLLGYDLSKPEDYQKVIDLDLIHTVCAKAVRDAAEILEEIR